MVGAHCMNAKPPRHTSNPRDEFHAPDWDSRSSSLRRNKLAGSTPELVAPAGDWECARAAIENGADAIYFGLDQFNARMRARNFTVEDLPNLMEFLHRRGAKGYVAFNTLVFPDEMERAAGFARSIIAAGVDAAIVQDVGLCRLLRHLSPDFPIRASTQMTITSARGVAFAADLGCELVVLAREVPLQEISRIRQALEDLEGQKVGRRQRLPLEVFVHGALCVAYSGQCLTSESLGGRSANRGVCAQACRLPYDLLADGHRVELGDRRYLLSPQDLVGLELLPDLIAAGVASLKIEGRLKTPEYVANITRTYREALDRIAATEDQSRTDPASAGRRAERAAREIMRERRYDLEMAFSRGLHTGWMAGVDNQALVHARFGKKRGVYLGRVLDVKDREVKVEANGPLKPGDGVVFDGGRPDLEEQGGRVYEILPVRSPGQDQPTVRLRFGRGDLDFRRIREGDRLWKTSDPELDRRLRRSFADPQPRFTRPIHVAVAGSLGVPLALTLRDECGHVVTAESRRPLVLADRQPLTPQRLRDQLGRLGGTPFHLETFESRVPDNVILPLSELNHLRRTAVQALDSARARPIRWTLIGDAEMPFRTHEGRNEPTETRTETEVELTVLVRSLEQLHAVLAAGIRTVYCDFEDPRRYRDAVGQFRQARTATRESSHSAIYLAPPRIFKMGEEGILRQILSCQPDGVLARNIDHLEYFKELRQVGDYSLNVANRWAAQVFLERYPLERLTASYDLDHVQLAALVRSAPPEWFEITIHQHMPMFHMEHCVFCAFLSQGTDSTNCGRPCDHHQVRLRDRTGVEHPVLADVGCRNTVFNGVAQTGAEHVAALVQLGARRLRLEFVHETAEQAIQTVECYRSLAQGQISGSQLWRRLKVLNHVGVTRGPLG